MYCLKCKKSTASKDLQEELSKNNRRMQIAYCTICNTKKCKFVGSGLIDKLPFELHLPSSSGGENMPSGSFNNLNKYSFCGPGTRYEQRRLEGYNGINELDKMCKLHDQFYTNNLDTASRNISDAALAHRAEEIANDPRFDSTQRNMASLVHHIMKSKVKFGLGTPGSQDSKN